MLSYDEIKTEYDLNQDFKLYVDKYCNYYTEQIPLEKALLHKIVNFVGEIYKNERINFRKEH